jgi:hypothetical protein
VIPDIYFTGHEAEFAEVTKKYLRYLVDGEMPAWEVTNMIQSIVSPLKTFKWPGSQNKLIHFSKI